MNGLKIMRVIALMLLMSLIPQTVLAKSRIRDWLLFAWLDIIRVHFFGPQEVDRRLHAHWQEIAPKNWDMLISVESIEKKHWRRKKLSCDELRPVSFRDWYEKGGGKIRKNAQETASFHVWSVPA